MRKAHRPRRLVSDHFQCCEATNPHLSIFSPSKPHPRMTPSSHELSCILKSHAIIARGRTLKLDLCLSNRSKAHVRTADHTKWVGAFHRKEDFVDVVEVDTVRKAVEARKEQGNPVSARLNGMRQDLMRIPNNHPHQGGRTNHYAAQDNNDFISSKSDRQLLLMKRRF